MYQAEVIRIRNVRPHPNADRVLLATCQGNQVVVGIDTQEGDLGVYFPSDGVLSEEFCHNNNLFRKPELNKDPDAKPGMFDTNCRVRAQKFRQEKSDGFFVSLTHFNYLKAAERDLLVEGFQFTELGKSKICEKYVNQATQNALRERQLKKSRTAKTSVMFKEHFDTSHFGNNVHKFGKSQTIIITEKVHGTSFRVGHVLVEKKLRWIDRVAKKLGIDVRESNWEYLNGTRHTVLEETTGQGYHDPTIREKAFALFNKNLRKGETVFGEIVGYESTGATIMPGLNTSKVFDKKFIKEYGEKASKDFIEKYGDRIEFSYGCTPNECQIYVYRITSTNEDGQSIDYSWDDVVKRCAELGVKPVPFLKRITFEEIEALLGTVDDRDVSQYFINRVEELGDGPSSLDPRHIKEGVCVRIEGGLDNQTYKFKNFTFRLLEGIIKDSGAVDTEEAS
jgi:hypothetical protein